VSSGKSFTKLLQARNLQFATLINRTEPQGKGMAPDEPKVPIYTTFTAPQHHAVLCVPTLNIVGGQSIIADLTVVDFKARRAQSFLWRVIAAAERFWAATLLLVLFPVLSVVALLIVILSRRSPLIAHQRVGRGGRPIWVLKLRTMWNRNSTEFDLPALVEHLPGDFGYPVQTKARVDPRVTSRFASLCRRYSIDECPQLWHVVTGDMAFIGPRPLTAAELDAHYGSTAIELLGMKPGLSGLWQINGRSRLTYRQRRRLDLFMVRKWSASLYVHILLSTVPTVLTGRNAW
jgi:lipopolysaccharide/colanic/teichoic acid biosynthesis glycosyltransferase